MDNYLWSRFSHHEKRRGGLLTDWIIVFCWPGSPLLGEIFRSRPFLGADLQIGIRDLKIPGRGRCDLKILNKVNPSDV